MMLLKYAEHKKTASLYVEPTVQLPDEIKDTQKLIDDDLMMMFDIYAYVHHHVGPTAANRDHAAFRQRPFRQPLHHAKP